MKKPQEERRKYSRYDTGMKVFFQVKYDLKTKVKFQVVSPDKKIRLGPSYEGVSKNISVEGLGFISKKKLQAGDTLMIDIYAPHVNIPVQMQGQVRWCKKIPGDLAHKSMYHTGVKLLKVNSEPVAPSIYFDEQYKVIWSVVLESVFSSFQRMMKQKKEN